MLFLWVFVIVFALWTLKLNQHKIPGPTSFPFWGSLITMITFDNLCLRFPYRVMHRMSEHYGKVMRVLLGDQEWFIISGLEEIKQFSMMEESTFHLPSKTFNEMYSFDKPLDGNVWREQRRFAMKTLKQLGLGRNSLEHHIEAETVEVCKFLADRVNSGPIDIRIDEFFDLPCLNVIWSLVNTSRFDYEDKHLKRMIELIDRFTMNNFVGPLGIKKHMDIFKSYIVKLVSDQKLTFDEDNLRGYVDHFLCEVGRTSEAHYTDHQLAVTLIDFFTGGSGTMSKTLGFAFLFCLKNPDILHRVQEELERVTGHKDGVSLEDRPDLVITEATLLEVARLASVLPIAPPRLCPEDVQVGNWTIPRGGRVQMNLYSLHRNKEHWGDPHTFRPERFIRNGVVFQDDWLQPFSYGKRKCIGESVAKNTVFLMFANVIKKFNIAPSKSYPLPDENPVGGLTIGPQTFFAEVSLR